MKHEGAIIRGGRQPVESIKAPCSSPLEPGMAERCMAWRGAGQAGLPGQRHLHMLKMC